MCISSISALTEVTLGEEPKRIHPFSCIVFYHWTFYLSATKCPGPMSVLMKTGPCMTDFLSNVRSHYGFKLGYRAKFCFPMYCRKMWSFIDPLFVTPTNKLTVRSVSNPPSTCCKGRVLALFWFHFVVVGIHSLRIKMNRDGRHSPIAVLLATSVTRWLPLVEELPGCGRFGSIKVPEQRGH